MALERYGKVTLPGTTGNYIQVNADGAPRWGAIGYTIAWDLLDAATAVSTVTTDSTPIYIGDKVLPFGTVLTKIASGDYAGYYAPYDSTVRIANPTTAPTLTEGGAGALAAGVYKVAYAYRNGEGTTLVSTLGSVTIGASKKIHVAAFTIPDGVTSVDWYVSKAADSVDIGFNINKTVGTAFDINSVGTSTEEPSANTTRAAGLGTLGRGTTGIVNVTIKEADRGADVIGLLVGGVCWKERIKAGGAGQPSFADLEAALPLLDYVKA